MNENRIEKMWHDFAKNQMATIHKEEQQLLIFPDKRKVYSVSEIYNRQTIFYEYKFHSNDPIGGGSFFRIAIPIVTKNKFLIYRPSILRRILFKEKLKIRPINSIELNQKIANSLIKLFKYHPDIKIWLGVSNLAFNKPIVIKNNILLEMHTKHLPVKYEELKCLRDVMLELMFFLSDEKVIMLENNV